MSCAFKDQAEQIARIVLQVKGPELVSIMQDDVSQLY